MGPKNINIVLASQKLVKTIVPKSQKKSAPNHLKFPMDIPVPRKINTGTAQNRSTAVKYQAFSHIFK